MSLGTIQSIKELSLGYQTLLLCEIQFQDNSWLRMSTHDLRSSTTGIQWNGNDYLPRILNGTELSTTQALSSLGIDTIPQITIKLADADKTLWQNYEATAGKGFRGATVALRFVYFDVVGGQFSSDSIIKFVGTCEGANSDEDTLTVKAVNRLNMAKASLPALQFQRICPWVFPDTSAPGLTTGQAAAIRQAAADDRTSPSWNCGYSPDATGPNARGNYSSGTTPFTTCDQSPGNCMARMGNPGASTKSYGAITGDITQDTSSRATGRFGGICWPIPVSWEGIAYGQAKSTKWNPNWKNDPLYTQFIPLIYGTCLVYPVVTNVVGDPNSTRGECILQQGPVQSIYAFNINDHDLQPTNQIGQLTGNFVITDKLRRYTILTEGDRNGAVTLDSPYNGNGDPTGGMCRIEWCCYSNEAPSSAPPTIRCIVQGTKVPAISPFTSMTSGVVTVVNNLNYGEGTEVTIMGTGNSAVDGKAFQTLNNSNTQFQLVGCSATTGAGYFVGAINDVAQNLGSTVSGITQGANQPINVNGQSANPVWAILDVLVKGGLGYDDIDIPSWIAAAAVCDRQISFTQSDGSTANHALYSTSFVMKDQKSIADTVRGLRLACKATLRPTGSGTTGGLLGIIIDETLAEQQPSVISDSNYTTAVASLDHTGTVTNGYVAYKFDESTILRNGKKSTLEITQQPINNSYNSCSFSFQDSANSYVDDSVTVRSSQDINNIGQEVSYSLPVLGINSYDHAKRIGAWFIAKGLQGNPRGDSSGTWFAKFQTSARAQHLQIGDLILLSSAQHGITNQLFRVTSITPTTNWESMTIEASFHLDSWYVDNFGQTSFQLLPTTSQSLIRPPLPWSPGQDAPINSSDPFGKTPSFDIAQVYTSADLSGQIYPEIVINGNVPTTNVSTRCVPPLFDMVPMPSSMGGTIQCNAAYAVCICTMGDDGFWSAPSRVAQLAFSSGGTNTNTITLTGLDWRAVNISGATVTPTGYGIFAGPDNNHMTLQGSLVTGSFPSSVVLTSYAPGSTQLPDGQFDHFRTKIYEAHHTGSWGGQVTSRTSSTIVSTGAGWTSRALVGRVVSVIARYGGTSVAVFNYAITGNTTDTLTVTGNPLSDGVNIADVIVVRLGVTSATATTITESALTTPLATNAEKGKTLWVIQGTGKGQRWPIASNTGTTVTINGVFNPALDTTSVWIVTETGVFDYADSAAMPVTMTVSNEAGSTIVVEVVCCDSNGQESVSNLSPVRDMWIWGCQGTRTITSSQSQLNTDWRVSCDTTSGNIVFTLLPYASVANQTLLVEKITSDANTVTVNTTSPDTFTDGSTSQTLSSQGDNVYLKF